MWGRGIMYLVAVLVVLALLGWAVQYLWRRSLVEMFPCAVDRISWRQSIALILLITTLFSLGPTVASTMMCGGMNGWGKNGKKKKLMDMGYSSGAAAAAVGEQ